MSFSRSLSRKWQAKLLPIASVLVIAILLLVPLLFKLNGKPHADWQQFLGRFHVLAVHLPIALILLVPLLEIAGRYRPALREAAVLVLLFSIVACMGTFTLGYLLAYGSGTAGAGVTHHMWGGLWLTIGVLLCYLIRPSWESGRVPYAYPALLTCVLLVMVWTAHEGGSLTHGRNYLTEYAPAPLKKWPGLGRVEAKDALVPNSFYAEHIDPIFDANCVACHDAAKTKGDLRLDAFNLLMEGGQEGAVIVPGHPERSILFQRITLPHGDKKAMPAEDKPPLKPEEITWIKAWIAQGASPSVPSLAGIVAPKAYREIALPQVGDYSGMLAQISQIDASQGVKLVPVSRKLGDGLILNTVNVAATFNDAQLAQFEKFAPYIVEVYLGRTKVSDKCFDTLKTFTHLRSLNLEETAVTGQGVGKLAGLSQLTYLNLSGTKVTQANLAPALAMRNLHHLYFYNTPAQAAATAQAASAPSPRQVPTRSSR
ncbi:MAG: c-type cytochrome domain-containing protein [Acidobacteriaceae bacterium]